MKINGYDIEVEKKNIKNINMYVRKDGSIKITAPRFVSKKQLKDFVISHVEWIEKAKQRVGEKNSRANAPFFNENELLLFGRAYRVSLATDNRFSITLNGETAEIRLKEGVSDEQKEKLIKEWYRSRLYEMLETLVPKWERITGLKCSSYRIKDMKTRWGTCNTKTKTLWFSLRLAQLDTSCLEYVVLHELTHTVIPNHGGGFKAQLTKYMPDWREIQSQMKH